MTATISNKRRRLQEDMLNDSCTCFFEEVLPSGDTEPKKFQGLDQLVFNVGPHHIALHVACPQTDGGLSVGKDGCVFDRTGMLLWPGSTALTHALLKIGDLGLLTHSSVLELGCGLGLCGLIASLYAAGPVILTDQTGPTRAVARENIRCNQHLRGPLKGGCLAEVRKLDWLSASNKLESLIDEAGPLCFDLIIASDVLYVDEPRWGGLDMDDLEKFFGTISQNLAPGGLALMSYANRENGIEAIVKAASQSGLLCEQVPLGNFVAKAILCAYGAKNLAMSVMFSFTAVTDAKSTQVGDRDLSSLVKAALAQGFQEMPLSLAKSSA